MRSASRTALLGLTFCLPLALSFALAEPADGFTLAFHWGYAPHTAQAGAGFVYGTGSQQDKTITCGFCHVNDSGQQGQIDLVLTPTPAWQTVNGNAAYKPGQTYTINVQMVGAHLGTAQDDSNNFALTVEDQAGKFQGVLTTDACPSGPGSCYSTTNCLASFAQLDKEPGPPATTFMFGGCKTIFAVHKQNPGVTNWKFDWTAPAAGAGKLTMYWGAVDGNQASHSSLGDDVKMGTLKLDEGS